MKKNETNFRTLINYLRQNVNVCQIVIVGLVYVIVGIDVDLSFE